MTEKNISTKQATIL